MERAASLYEVLSREVGQNKSGKRNEALYGQGEGKLALMNGQTLTKAFVPLPAGAAAVYNSSGLSHYRHSDWPAQGGRAREFAW